MSSLFRPKRSFLQNTAWQHSAINALHYNTSQQGSVLPLIYGTVRVQMNLIDLNDYRGPKGKKGKVGSIPLSGTSQTGKGSGGSKGKGAKKNKHYSVNIDVAICQGPVHFDPHNTIYSSSGVEQFGSSILHFYEGQDGQALDPHFNKVNYSGTCHVTGTPIDLGQSPVVPNIGFEINGFMTGINTGPSNPKDANPAECITDFLTNPRYGAGFPPECVAPLTRLPGRVNTYGDYCQSNYLLISVALDGHMKAIEWMQGICQLTNSAMVWSGKQLKIIPYGDAELNRNGAHWIPDFVPKYDLDDDDFLPFAPHQDGAPVNPGDDDPIIITRSNPADADNWHSIEYTDRKNFYASTILTAFDQGAIDTYGLRIGDSIAGRAFADLGSASISLQILLQRKLYVRNTGVKFQVGWRYALLEPMDFVSVTGLHGDKYLDKYPVRITAIEENDNGDLIITGEDPQPGTAAPMTGETFRDHQKAVHMTVSGCIWPSTTPGYATFPNFNWEHTHPPDSRHGSLSVWVKITEDEAPTGPDGAFDSRFFFVHTQPPDPSDVRMELGLGVDWRGRLFGWVAGSYTANKISLLSNPEVLKFDGQWHHVLFSWASPKVNAWVDGERAYDFALSSILIPWYDVKYSNERTIIFYSGANFGVIGGTLRGCTQDLWFDGSAQHSSPSSFRNPDGSAKDLGPRGEYPFGKSPHVFLHYPAVGNLNPNQPGLDQSYYAYNRAGFKPDDHLYWENFYGVSGSGGGGDLAYPNLGLVGASLTICNDDPYL
jgi:hypothetical protein